MSNLADIKYRLLSPWRYLFIKEQSGLLRWINWIIPGIMALLLMAVNVLISKEAAFKPVIFSFKEVVYILPGFFIAALAAIAVFEKASMDQPMPGSSTTVKLLVDASEFTVNLTRRRFLSMTFSFLSAQSLLLSILLVFAESITISPAIIQKCSSIGIGYIIRFMSIFILLFIFSQIVIVTIHGLYYLGERLHNTN